MSNDMEALLGVVFVVIVTVVLAWVILYILKERYFASEEFLAHKAAIAFVRRRAQRRRQVRHGDPQPWLVQTGRVVHRHTGASGVVPEHQPLDPFHVPI
jgi:hypothetical protein